jgi:hypothetical protein
MKQKIRPEGATGWDFALPTAEPDLKQSYLQPFQGGFMGWIHTWVKNQAES